MSKKKEKSIFRQEVERDINTFKRLGWRKKIQFVYDYYKWYILAAVTAIIIIATFAKLLYDGNKPTRLHACVVLNTEEDPTPWFNRFEEDLKKDGKPGAFDLNKDQPFDPENTYFNLMQVEVQAMVSSYRMDVAICGPALYEFLLYMNACYPLNDALAPEDFAKLQDSGRLVEGTANLKYNKDGSIDDSEAVKGLYAIDISDTEFGKTYNNDGENTDPLYAILLINTKNMEDSLTLLHQIAEF